MKFLKEILQILKITYTSFKTIIGLIIEKKWIRALQEIGTFFKTIYANHIKGKYVEIKGKRIPMSLVLIIGVCFLYIAYPSGEESVSAPVEQETAEINTYDNNGIKIYDMDRCDDAACGTLENNSETAVAEVAIQVSFYAENIAVCQGQAVAQNVAPNTKAHFSIPCTIDFETFKLTDVIIKPME